jgi:hypothetical protein
MNKSKSSERLQSLCLAVFLALAAFCPVDCHAASEFSDEVCLHNIRLLGDHFVEMSPERKHERAMKESWHVDLLAEYVVAVCRFTKKPELYADEFKRLKRELRSFAVTGLIRTPKMHELVARRLGSEIKALREGSVGAYVHGCVDMCVRWR